MAFGMPVSLTLDDLMAGRTQPMGAGERTKAGGAVATLPMGLRSAVAVTDKAAEPRHAAPAHRGAAAFGVQTLEAGMRRTSDFGLLGASLARPIASKPALIATRAAAPKAVTKSQSAAAAIPVRDAPAKFGELLVSPNASASPIDGFFSPLQPCRLLAPSVLVALPPPLAPPPLLPLSLPAWAVTCLAVCRVTMAWWGARGLPRRAKRRSAFLRMPSLSHASPVPRSRAHHDLGQRRSAKGRYDPPGRPEDPVLPPFDAPLLAR